MASYTLVDIDDNTYNLPLDIVIPDDEKVKAENQVIERSFRDGAVFTGLLRIKSNEITLQLPHWNTTDAGFRSLINTIMAWCLKAVTLRDNTRSIETSIVYEQSSIKWDKGSHLRSSDNTITFTRLNPYWEDIAYTIDTVPGTPVETTGSFVITNAGYTEMPVLITLSSPAGLVPEMIFFVTENNQGITIEDPAFGNNVLDIFIINTNSGVCTLNGNKRSQYITANTGFPVIPFGSGTFNYDILGNVGFTVKYKARYFI
jgi:hypothetical protein